MNVDLTPEQQSFVQRAIQSGRIRRAEEAAQEAFNLWVERERAKTDKPAHSREVAQAAAARILSLREGNVLPEGLTIRSLIDAGRD